MTSCTITLELSSWNASRSTPTTPGTACSVAYTSDTGNGTASC